MLPGLHGYFLFTTPCCFHLRAFSWFFHYYQILPIFAGFWSSVTFLQHVMKENNVNYSKFDRPFRGNLWYSLWRSQIGHRRLRRRSFWRGRVLRFNSKGRGWRRFATVSWIQQWRWRRWLWWKQRRFCWRRERAWPSGTFEWSDERS